MRARPFLYLAGLAVLISIVVSVRPQRTDATARVAQIVNDTLPWTPDDATLIGRTGRPQIVEFYHPT